MNEGMASWLLRWREQTCLGRKERKDGRRVVVVGWRERNGLKRSAQCVVWDRKGIQEWNRNKKERERKREENKEEKKGREGGGGGKTESRAAET
jgi:TfoX/Sxy family transcriptional regulator of competence genes